MIVKPTPVSAPTKEKKRGRDWKPNFHNSPQDYWKSSRQISGYRAQLMSAINICIDDAYVQVDIKTARKLVEICNQAIHTEGGHGK